jgi:hypothetical protein
MKRSNLNAPIAMIVITLILSGCITDSSSGPIIATIQDNEISITISNEKIQNGLSDLLKPTGQEFTISEVEVVSYQEKYFLSIIGPENQKCMILLQRINENLFEANNNEIPIVICSGCSEGCEPVLSKDGWFCSDGCDSCKKTSSVSDHYIFD